ncbi:DUF1223 domain-containing protein [Paracoccus sp. 11-3]|uniref:DUF1223 domain-containing protein n=1 Tax=Paracoccus amoyensis TaxID=2760093 RepID=A0A926JDJ9_9RHOB|nr:DUF1223 domain-containing protein [Paracoccus amoyensis]MBC9248215.1 DUF1223 domain-containing protein [Paracoccus amoyensis]
MRSFINAEDPILMALATGTLEHHSLNLRRVALQGTMLALMALQPFGAAFAQGPGGSGGAGGRNGPGGQAGASDMGGAPVISAPDDSSRLQPAPGAAFAPPETATYNSFAATDAVTPPMEEYGLTVPSLPVVVELFTSQGCSSCPPADAMLAALANDPNVLPLSFHVDYWDYLGWADSFARPEFTERQELYARAAGERSLYTPQLIVDGQDTALAPGPAQLMGLIDASRVAPTLVSVRRESTGNGEAIELMPLSDIGGQVDILLVRYVPERQIEVKAGENRGKVVTYTNVVVGMDQLAEWDGNGPLRMTIRPDGAADESMPADTKHVLLVQREDGGADQPGPILAAIRLD